MLCLHLDKEKREIKSTACAKGTREWFRPPVPNLWDRQIKDGKKKALGGNLGSFVREHSQLDGTRRALEIFDFHKVEDHFLNLFDMPIDGESMKRYGRLIARFFKGVRILTKIAITSLQTFFD